MILCSPSWRGVARAEDAAPTPAPLVKVVMFSSGVGYFEHQADVEGDAQVELKLSADDVNDLLKSLVLSDLGGGTVAAVTYGSKDPITKTLKSFAIDLTENPSLADLLDQIRGERVEIESPDRTTGVILGVERRQQKVDEEVVTVEVLNLLTDEGLRAIPMQQVGRIRLLNEQLDAELRQALAALALADATDMKTVALRFEGQGARNVRFGYVRQAPIWKTSYRLVLRDDESPRLQGWAIVENTGETDWQDVRLTLVSGRPISYIMDLYEPLYLDRPVVEPELFASLRPPKYDQDLAANERFSEMRGKAAMPAASAARAFTQAPEAADKSGFAFGGAMANDAVMAGRGVQSTADAGDVGELFQYAIDAPVTLARQKSAMLPIVHQSIEAEKVSIYNPAVQAKHPLNGLKVVNSTELHLMQGPITVFDGGAYAGDAQIDDLAPGADRLISYAIDLETEVASRSAPAPEQLLKVRIAKGVLFSTRKLKRTTEYTVKNSGADAKQVLIEQPIVPSWELASPEKPAEETRDVYRFAVSAKPGEPAVLTVDEVQTIEQQAVLTNINDGLIRFYLNARVVSDQVKQALEEIVRRKQHVESLANRRQSLERQIEVIVQEQDRIRQNMAQLERTSELYRRYVQKFGEQEDSVDDLRMQIEDVTQKEAEARRALDDYLIGLELE